MLRKIKVAFGKSIINEETGNKYKFRHYYYFIFSFIIPQFVVRAVFGMFRIENVDIYPYYYILVLILLFVSIFATPIE